MIKHSKSRLSIFALLIPLTTILLLSCEGFEKSHEPPSTPIDAVYDTLHGTEIVDYYRWLENGDDAVVKKWENEQDEYCRKLLAEYPKRNLLQTRIDRLMQIGTMGDPRIAGGKYFYKKRTGDMEHAQLLMKNSPDSEPVVILDPNTFSGDATVALDWWYPSTDGNMIAFGKSARGTENSTLYIYDVKEGEVLDDTIPYVRNTSVAWLNDNSGFYYARYPQPGEVPEGEEEYYRKIYFHELGRFWKEDPLIFGEGREKTEWSDVKLSPNNRYLVINVWRGWSESEILFKERNSTGDFKVITSGQEGAFVPFPVDDGIFIYTDYRAPRYRIMKSYYDQPFIKNWELRIPETDGSKYSFGVTEKHLIVHELYNASSRILVYEKNGQFTKEIALPAIGSVMGDETIIFTEPYGNEVLFGYNSFFVPPRIYRYDLDSMELQVVDQIKTDLNLDKYTVSQVWYPSKDGTQISMFLVHKKDIELDGNNPAIVYGYGGFNSSEVPYFSRTMTMFYDAGGVYAYTQLRGGGEYGEEWHRQGMLENKQNTFDDFIAACEWLIENNYTNSEKLCIMGGSNGGLLVGAVMVQRPDLMKAVVSSRPLLDMLRYHKFLIGELWIPEYGSADIPEQFEFIYEYSPYHNIEKGTAYPAVLFESADHDTRVDPLHARKMTAALQAATSSGNPVLLRVQRQTGHGQGAPKRIIIEELLDEYCFIFRQLGI